MSESHMHVGSAVTADDVKSDKEPAEPPPQVPTHLYKPAPFSMRWIRGYNPRVPVINLNDRGSTIIFYAAANCGVLYNWTTNQMRILQGHKHTVTCLATDADGKWLVTADSGPENIITVWDSADLFPHKTLFNPHHSTKLSKVILSADAKYLLTLAYSSEKATLHWWIWSYGLSIPHAIKSVDISQNAVVDMAFNPENSTQFVLMTKLDIWIGISAKIFVMERGLLKETDDYELKIRKPEKNIGVEHGKLTCFTFVGNTSQILVGTSRGAMLVYGYTLAFQEFGDSSGYEELKYVKVVQVEKHKINVVKSVDDVIVTGNSQGDIRFYDEQLKLVYWVHGFRPDSVRSLSFNMSPRSYELLDPKCDKPCPCWEKVVSEVDPMTGVLRQRLITKKLPTDSTRQHRPFIVRDFVLSTHNEGIAFVDFATEKLQTIIDCKIHPATALTVHPEKPLVCLGYSNGLAEIFNFELHKLFKRIDLREYYKVIILPDEDSINQKTIITRPELIVSCLKYSPSGLHLACGLNTGQLLFLDPVTIAVISQTSDTSHSIKEVNYSCDSLTLAMADEGKTVCVYKYDCDKLVWNFIGKHRAHYKDITTVFFTPEKNKNGDYKLLSLGLDRIMVEYDIGNSSEEYLEILSLDRIEQTAVPLTGIYWPCPEYVDEAHRTDVPMILMANDEFKYKIVNYNTTMTLATYLGPRYEDAVCKMQLVTRRENNAQRQYLLYATRKIIGLQKMPLDGNPWKHTAMMGHPVQITQMCYREDIDTLFTVGYKDTCMIQWAAKYKSVETTTIQGGIDLDPYYCLVDGSRPGWLFQEIRDLFYYIQILCQGTFSPAMRTVKDVIPIESLPDLMRALGYFPSEYEVENLIVEAKFKVNQYTPSAEVDFEEFVKLYLNHRPAHGYNYAKLRNAFRNFASPKSDKNSFSYVIEREDFIDLLSNYGECFSREQSWYLLSILLGLSFEDRAALQANDFSFLPEEINFSEFVNSILGIHEIDMSERSFKSNVEQLSMGSLQASSTSSAPSVNK